MTDANREQHISQALSQYRQQQGTRDTLRVPLRSPQGLLLEVIEVPLELPVLNTDSFRIAPTLNEHPMAKSVRADPFAPTSQRIVSELVRKAHREVDDLKASLIDGQDQPGLITRKGKLINANTRCVLLRELRTQGLSTATTIRVAVLPQDVTEAEELELESVLQQQQEHKDEYNLVSELMMLKRLHESAHMSDAAIGKRLRRSAARVSDLRAVLDLMERARRLTTPILPMTTFVADRDKQQNWLELLNRVRDTDSREGRAAGDAVIGRWLIAYILGFNSVHKLRHAVGSWVETEVLPDLADGDDIAATVADAATATPPDDTPQPPPERPASLSLLGDEPPAPPDADYTAVTQLLNLTVTATNAGDSDITLPTGDTVPAADVVEQLSASVARGLSASKRRALASNKLQRPGDGLEQARLGLRDTINSLDEVGGLPEFEPHRDNALQLAEQVGVLLSRVLDALQDDDHNPSDD